MDLLINDDCGGVASESSNLWPLVLDFRQALKKRQILMMAECVPVVMLLTC